MTSLIGRRLGQYDIIDTLGEGGMASVYLGRQTSIDRLVAVKVLPPHPALNAAFKERFQLEAKTIGSLQHPSILPLYDYGAQDDVLYLVMAYAKDGSLDDVLDSEKMDAKTVERYLRIIAQGLDYSHSKGVIHRDIKPGNILLNGDHPMLADFGMVKLSEGQVNLTGTAIVGTPAYMAPEQGQGEKIDHRADIYSLGVMVYEMLAGRRPFVGETQMQVIISHIQDIPDPVISLRPDLPKALSDVIDKSLAKDPNDRYATAGDFAEAFSKALHADDSDVLNEVRKQLPLSPPDSVRKQPPTVTLDTMPSIEQRTVVKSRNENTLSETVVLRERSNPFVLIGGFALIAVAIIAGAFLVANRGGDDTQPLVVETEDVIVATDAPEEPTEIAVVIPTVPSVPSIGDVRYSTRNMLGDTITIDLDDVRPPTEDVQYAAWLLDTDSDETLFIGEINVDSFGEGVVNYTSEAEDGSMLAATYNAVAITLEEDGIGDVPTGEIMYSAFVPPAVSAGLREIFVVSEDGIETRGEKGSLLDGALLEASIAEQHAGLASRATSISSTRLHAEHTINILNGTLEDYDGSGTGQNPGRDIGLYFFLDKIEAILAEGTEGGSPELIRNAENIRVCTVNIRRWADEVIELELEMIAGEDIESIEDEAQESTVLMEQITTGFDANFDGIITPDEGECGLEQIPEFGLGYARMSVVEGNTIETE